MARKTKEEAQATRQRLLDTAEAIFLQRGVARTSLNDIACAAGLTRGAVYWHFEDKTALYSALMEQLKTRFNERLPDILEAQEADPMAVARRLVMLPVEMLRSDKHAQRLFTIAMHRIEFSEDLARIWQRHVANNTEYLDMLERLFDAASRSPHCALRLSPRAAALGLFSLVDGLLTYATLDPTRLQALSSAEDIIDTFLAGVGCPPADPSAG